MIYKTIIKINHSDGCTYYKIEDEGMGIYYFNDLAAAKKWRI